MGRRDKMGEGKRGRRRRGGTLHDCKIPIRRVNVVLGMGRLNGVLSIKKKYDTKKGNGFSDCWPRVYLYTVSKPSRPGTWGQYCHPATGARC